MSKRMVVMRVCLWMGIMSATSAFVHPLYPRRMSTIMMEAKSDGKKKAVSKRKPRFAQDAHSIAVPKTSSSNISRDAPAKSTPPPKRDFDNTNNHDSGTSFTPKNDRTTRTFQSRGSEKSSLPSSSSTRSKDNEKDNMWRSKKTISDLEATMSQRWGTALDRWTADPNEYQFVDEHGKTLNVNTDGVFRGKPVLDPWQAEERKTDQVQDGLLSASTGDDAVLNRVRRNQERLQKGRMENTLAQQSLDLNDEEDDDDDDDDFTNDDISDGSSMEFYDEDDEGYEPTQKDKGDDDESDRYQLNHLISPRPVGGRGSNSVEKVPSQQNDYKDEKDVYKPVSPRSVGSGGRGPNSMEKDSSPGYFFNNNAATGATDADSKAKADEEAEKEAQWKRNRNKSVSNLILDVNGNPLYMTVEQAKRDFESSLVVTDDDSDDTGSYTPPETRSWEDLGITSPVLLNNLQAMGCAAPLSVQDKACPPIVTGNDVLIGTYTGSGKTLAFLVPLAQRLLFSGASAEGDLQVMIIAPGRELASQIVSVARSLLEGTGLTAMLSIGGTTFTRNLEQIRKKKPTILVGTPGRIAELVIGRPGEKSGRLKVGNLQSVVMDEFDALLEYKPHRDPSKAIITTLKKRHNNLQSILCSATASDLMESKKVEFILRPGYAQAMADRDDQLITSGNDAFATTRVSRTVLHGVVHVPHRRLALESLRRVLHTEPIPQQVLIFADNARRVDIIIEKLANMGIIAAPLHGGFGSEKVDRAEVSKALREGYVGIVVATELAARGLDAPLLTHVINLDLPTDASHYAHRAGRCGRGGRPGVVINITTNPKERNVPLRFADNLGITMHTVDARAGKLCIVEPNPQLDENYRE